MQISVMGKEYIGILSSGHSLEVFAEKDHEVAQSVVK
jgi:hypothetical protein